MFGFRKQVEPYQKYTFVFVHNRTLIFRWFGEPWDSFRCPSGLLHGWTGRTKSIFLLIWRVFHHRRDFLERREGFWIACGMRFWIFLTGFWTSPSAFTRFYMALWHQFLVFVLYICLVRFAWHFVVCCACSAYVCLSENSVSVSMTVSLRVYVYGLQLAVFTAHCSHWSHSSASPPTLHSWQPHAYSTQL